MNTKSNTNLSSASKLCVRRKLTSGTLFSLFTATPSSTLPPHSFSSSNPKDKAHIGKINVNNKEEKEGKGKTIINKTKPIKFQITKKKKINNEKRITMQQRICLLYYYFMK